MNGKGLSEDWLSLIIGLVIFVLSSSSACSPEWTFSAGS